MPYDPAVHGERRFVGPGFHEAVYRVVKRIPSGRVASYGDVAEVLGLRTVARRVGEALSALPRTREDVPWHRVVNAAGRVSLRGDGEPSEEQARRLRREGLAVDAAGRVAEFERLRHRFRVRRGAS